MVGNAFNFCYAFGFCFVLLHNVSKRVFLWAIAGYYGTRIEFYVYLIIIIVMVIDDSYKALFSVPS